LQDSKTSENVTSILAHSGAVILLVLAQIIHEWVSIFHRNIKQTVLSKQEETFVAGYSQILQII
jgi:hypothetical protein